MAYQNLQLRNHFFPGFIAFCAQHYMRYRSPKPLMKWKLLLAQSLVERYVSLSHIRSFAEKASALNKSFSSANTIRRADSGGKFASTKVFRLEMSTTLEFAGILLLCLTALCFSLTNRLFLHKKCLSL